MAASHFVQLNDEEMCIFIFFHIRKAKGRRVLKPL
jgi:hypothetical protein